MEKSIWTQSESMSQSGSLPSNSNPNRQAAHAHGRHGFGREMSRFGQKMNWWEKVEESEEVQDSPFAAAIRAWSCSASVGGCGQGPVPIATSGPPVALRQKQGRGTPVNKRQLPSAVCVHVFSSLVWQLVFYDIKAKQLTVMYTA